MDGNKEPELCSPLTSSSEDYNLQLSAWSMGCLRKAATQLQLPRPRSLAWSVLLNILPPPYNDIRSSLQTHRNLYNNLRVKLSMDPRAVVGDDPLSQSDESAWKQHFCDNELKALIMQDVVRTFPDETYFRDQDVQDLMVRVLFFWSRSHSHVGYRQGMHEILAPLLYELHVDRKLAPEGISDSLKFILDENFLEHDSYMLFSGVMKGIQRFYTTGDVAPSSCGRMPVSHSVHNPNEVVRYLEKVRDEYLVPLDRELAMHLASCNITMELFGIRWLRLLFGREFPRCEIPDLWGYLFSDGPSLPFIHYVIVAMLISMRRILLPGSAGAALSALMRAQPAGARHVTALAQHLRSPALVPRPATPPPPPPEPAPSEGADWLEQLGTPTTAECTCVAEGVDVARELAALRVLRHALPRAVRQLRDAVPPRVAQGPLRELTQLSALLQCRNHALIDVETALEAAEGQTQHSDYNNIGKKQLLPVAIIGGKHGKKQVPQTNKIKEVQLKVFNQTECRNSSDFPSLDPLRMRTE